MQISFRERFIGSPNPRAIDGANYAPSTLGAPHFIYQTDYKVFKKTKEEKLEASLVKAQHKKNLLKAYGKGKIGRRLNVSASDT